MKRLLCILSSMNAGGAETFLMKVYRSLDRSKYQMDFCINTQSDDFYSKDILAMGGRIYRIPSKSESLVSFKKQLSSIIKNNNYEYVMRVTSSAMGFMDLKIAKKAGARICIARSSNSSDGGRIKSMLIHVIGRILYSRYVDVRIAPSDLAAEYTFGRKKYRNGEVNILRNGLDLQSFSFDSLARKKVRSEWNILDNQLVVGHIGRFSSQKNHMFLLDVFREIVHLRSDSKLILVGDGELFDSIRTYASIINLSDKVIFTGVRTDINSLLSAMDFFVFPSFYEGMPNSVIEAQATGLPCLISDSITKESDVTGLVHFLPLTNPRQWAETVIQTLAPRHTDCSSLLIKKGYDIHDVACQFERIVFN